jgi:hypothetical protein
VLRAEDMLGSIEAGGILLADRAYDSDALRKPSSDAERIFMTAFSSQECANYFSHAGYAST